MSGISFYPGGWIINKFGRDALDHFPLGEWISSANYIGGWDNGSTKVREVDQDYANLTADWDRVSGKRVRARGVDLQELRATTHPNVKGSYYEWGPGYHIDGLNGVSLSKKEAFTQEVVMKSVVSSTAALRTLFEGTLHGIEYASWFILGEGDRWTSHASENQGGQTYYIYQVLQILKEKLGDATFQRIILPRQPRRDIGGVTDVATSTAFLISSKEDPSHKFLVVQNLTIDRPLKIAIKTAWESVDSVDAYAINAHWADHNRYREGKRMTLDANENIVEVDDPKCVHHVYAPQSVPVPEDVRTWIFDDALGATALGVPAGNTMMLELKGVRSKGDEATLPPDPNPDAPDGVTLTSSEGVAVVSGYEPVVGNEIVVTPDGGSAETYTITQAMVDDFANTGAFVLRQPEPTGTTGLNDTVTYGGEIIVHDADVVVARTYETVRLGNVIATGPSYTVTQDDIDVGVDMRVRVITGLGTLIGDNVSTIYVPPYEENPYLVRSGETMVGGAIPAPANPVTLIYSFRKVGSGVILGVAGDEWRYYSPVNLKDDGNIIMMMKPVQGGNLQYVDSKDFAYDGDLVTVGMSVKPSSDGVTQDGARSYFIQVNDDEPVLYAGPTTYDNSYLSQDLIVGGTDVDLRLLYVEEVYTDFEVETDLRLSLVSESGALVDPFNVSARAPAVHMRDQDFADGTNRGSGTDFTVETV